MEPIYPKYNHFLDILDVAFQPIVDIHSGDVFGVEALLRGTQRLGYATIESFFDYLYEQNILYTFDIALREKVVKKFCSIEFYKDIKLFYNLDNRLFQMVDFSKGNTSRILAKFGLDHKSIIFELSEHNEITNIEYFKALMEHYANEGYCIAIDDFGIGQSGYKMLYHTTPNIIKIDRFFLSNINSDPKKKVLARQMVQLATLLGCRVIAEGVETQAELFVCKDIGCHMVQGYLVERPATDVRVLQRSYELLKTISAMQKREIGDQMIIRKRLESFPTVDVRDSMEMLLDIFNDNQDLTLIPIVDQHGAPLGIIHEHKLKAIICSPFGQSLVKNHSSNFSVLSTYMERLPIVDIKMPLETIVELFSMHLNASGVLVTESSKYIGYLSARILIEAVHERSLVRARDQNPLSRLPGNFMINEQIAYAFDSNEAHAFCYFDFDHFKPYNDYYGFRNGDRVIVLFAELMHKIFTNGSFVGHIGGDDFFALHQVENEDDFALFCLQIEEIVHRFKSDVLEFYSQEDRERGFIATEDRDGIRKEFKLLSVSAAVVLRSKHSSIKTTEALQKIFAIEKKNAKKSPNHIKIVTE